MTATANYLAANKAFSASRPANQLPLPPSKQVLVLTCMDARILPEAALGLKEGEAHVVRNAGGRAPEALRSIVISQQLLATKEILVIQHTDCGMVTFTTDQARGLIAKNLNLSADSTGRKTLDQLEFLEFPEVENNVKADVEFLKKSELVDTNNITGYVYDVKSGALKQVA
ncbi:putative carbonic anhydrase [Meira miltonrushii]|uniref:Carbonic anhydrase n=1 Tax=Meira miltonrushii TaxID=1280837 RepID=A0A316VHD1_9BASI|nr:putative carbonic anhydrase [Meira miltonrushii]PWN37049.1 putative carbonic anhydrase [Meira miltonrushii]